MSRKNFGTPSRTGKGTPLPPVSIPNRSGSVKGERTQSDGRATSSGTANPPPKK